jgi:hypothetical protein
VQRQVKLVPKTVIAYTDISRQNVWVDSDGAPLSATLLQHLRSGYRVIGRFGGLV